MIAISGDQRGPNLRISAEKRGFLVPVRSLGISGRKGKKPRNLKDCRALKLAGWTGLEPATRFSHPIKIFFIGVEQMKTVANKRECCN